MKSLKLFLLFISLIIISSDINARDKAIWWKNDEPKPTGFGAIDDHKAPTRYSEGEGYRAPASQKNQLGYSTSR